MDLYPYREEGRGAVSESVAFLREIEAALDGDHCSEIDRLIAAGDATASARWVRKFVFGGRHPRRPAPARRSAPPHHRLPEQRR
ncbi:MAG: hypothetical protein ACREFZ_09110, partial [Acetobacteraceae bacterium]